MTDWYQQLGHATLNWANLPFWQGPQDRLGAISHHPLALSVSREGLLVQVDTDGSVADVVANYADAGYGFITPPPGTTSWGTMLGEAKLRTLEAFVGNLDGMRILEIGGGNLFLASSLHSKYRIQRYVAIDPAITIWPDLKGVESLRTYFPSSDLSGEHFDLVLAHNVLEHIPDAFSFLGSVRDVLVPNGRAFLTFPDVARQFAHGDLNAILHEHLLYLNETSARTLFAKSGLSVVKWESAADLASCLLALAPPNKGVVSEAVTAATKLLSTGIEGFLTLLPKAVSALNREIEMGRKVAFYGATNGLNNLLSLTGSGQNIPILDGDRAKHGRFIPEGLQAIQWVGNSDPRQYEMIFVTAGSFQPAIIKELTTTYAVPRDRITGIFRSC